MVRPWILLVCWLLLVGPFLTYLLPHIVRSDVHVYLLRGVLWLATAALPAEEWFRYRRQGIVTPERRLALTCLLGGLLQVALAIVAGAMYGFRLSPFARQGASGILRTCALSAQLLALEFARWYLATPPQRGRRWVGYILACVLPWLLGSGPQMAARPELLDTLTGSIGRELVLGAPENMLATYLVLVGGPPASLVYRGTVAAFEWLAPVLPDLSWSASVLMALGAPLAGWLVVFDRVQQKRLYQRLERLVGERTSELSEANAQLRAEMEERLRAEEQLKRRNRQLAALNSAASVLASSLEASRFQTTLAHLLEQELGIRGGALYRCQKGQDSLSLVSAWGPHRELLTQIGDLPTDPFLGSGSAGGAAALRWLGAQDVAPAVSARPTAGDQDAGSCSWLPLRASEELRGAICLCGLDRAAISPDEIAFFDALCREIALAMHNGALYEELYGSRQRLQALSRRLVEAQEAERRHIARELHDEAGQALASFLIGLRLVEWDVAGSGPIHERVIQLGKVAEGISESLHRLATNLRPASLDHLGLIAALRQCARDLNDQEGLEVQFEVVDLDSERLPPATETALFRIVQEALTNVVRHARATRADVVLERRGDALVAIVEDNGVGFDPVEAMKSERLGLLGMRERAEMLGGSLTIEATPGAGTTIVVEVPYEHSHSDR